MIAITSEADAMASALYGARVAAAEASRLWIRDDGSCNLDTCVLVTTLDAAIVQRSAELARVRVTPKGEESGEWWVWLHEGQAAKRTAMAEAAADAIRLAGLQAYVWYHLD